MNNFVVFVPKFLNGVAVGKPDILCVATEERAKEVASGHPARSYRPMTDAEKQLDEQRRRAALAE